MSFKTVSEAFKSRSVDEMNSSTVDKLPSFFPEKFLDDPDDCNTDDNEITQIISFGLTNSKVWSETGAPLNVEKDWNVGELKEYITTKTFSISSKDFELEFNEETLKDKTVLKKILQHGETLYLKTY